MLSVILSFISQIKNKNKNGGVNSGKMYNIPALKQCFSTTILTGHGIVTLHS